MATTTNPPRGLDSELTHIVTELFANNHGIKSSLKANNINSRMDLHDALSKPELMKHVRWKNGDPKNGEVITSDVYRELILVPSFVNWLQNNHGTLPDCPIDFEHQVTRSKFTMFLLLDNYGRRGQHGDGTVSYDHTIAHESEKRHKRGAYAPSISVSPAAASIPAVASSVGPPASSATTSAGINTTPTTTAGNNNNTTAAPQASITGNNPSSAVQGGNNNPPPTVQVPPTAPPQAVPTRESQSKMATSVSSCEVDDSNVRDTSFIVSDPYLDIDDCSDSTEDGTSFAPETIRGFRDFKEEFDFKVRSRWRRPCTHITGLFEEHVPTTTNRIVARNMGNAENLQEYDSGLSMDQVTNYHVSVAHSSTDTSGLIDRRVNSGLAKLAANGCITHDHPQILRGEQCLATVDKWLLTGHRIQLDFGNGLSYIKMQYPIEKDMRLSHVIMTGEVAWNPTKYNKKLSRAVRDFNPAGTSSDLDVLHPSFDQFGELITARYGELGPEEMEATVDLLSVSIRYQRRVDTAGEMFSVVKDPILCVFHMEFNAEMYADMYQSCALLGNIDVHYTSQTSAPVGYQDTRKYFLYDFHPKTTTIRTQQLDRTR